MIQNFAIIETKSKGEWAYNGELDSKCTFLMCDYEFYDELIEHGNKGIPKDISVPSANVIEYSKYYDCFYLSLEKSREIFNMFDIETRPNEEVFGITPKKDLQYRVIFWFINL